MERSGMNFTVVVRSCQSKYSSTTSYLHHMTCKLLCRVTAMEEQYNCFVLHWVSITTEPSPSTVTIKSTFSVSLPRIRSGTKILSHFTWFKGQVCSERIEKSLRTHTGCQPDVQPRLLCVTLAHTQWLLDWPVLEWAVSDPVAAVEEGGGGEERAGGVEKSGS